jgi:hypothetical protein
MQDSFSSVENMLRWQIDNANRRINELELFFNNAEELYPLPKQTHGLPDSWAFGKLTSNEVSLAQAQHGLNFVKSQLELTETDLSNGDLPSAIYRIINVYNSIASISASWTGAASVRTYRYVKRIREIQSINAKRLRSQIKKLIEKLALSEEHNAESAKQLWTHFFSELETSEFDPEEINNMTDLSKSAYEYNFLGKRKRITFGQFANIVSDYRKFKSR